VEGRFSRVTRTRALAWLLVACACAPPLHARTPATAVPAATALERFGGGLAERDCAGTTDLQRRYAAESRKISGTGESARLFAHVVDALVRAHLPTQYAMIPLIESGYRADARSAAGPAGLWQLVRPTARRMRLQVGPGYDARLSAEESTRAAVRYLSMLHRMFGGDWRLAVMAYNAGEGRVLDAVGRSGGKPRRLARIPASTRRYARTVEALSCLVHRDSAADMNASTEGVIPAVALRSPGPL